MELNSMTKAERISHFATAPRAYAGTIDQLEDGDFRRYWAGKLRGRFITRPDGRWKFQTRAEAVDAARQFRELARSELADLKQGSNALANLPGCKPGQVERPVRLDGD